MRPTKAVSVRVSDGGRVVASHGGSVVLDLDPQQASALGHLLGETTAWMNSEPGSITPDEAGDALGDLWQRLTGIGMGLRAIEAPDEVQQMLSDVMEGVTGLLDDLATTATSATPLGGRPARFTVHGHVPDPDEWVQLVEGTMPDDVADQERHVTVDLPGGVRRIALRVTPARLGERTGLLTREEQAGVAAVRAALDALERSATGEQLIEAMQGYAASRTSLDDMALVRSLAVLRAVRFFSSPPDDPADVAEDASP